MQASTPFSVIKRLNLSVGIGVDGVFSDVTSVVLTVRTACFLCTTDALPMWLALWHGWRQCATSCVDLTQIVSDAGRRCLCAWGFLKFDQNGSESNKPIVVVCPLQRITKYMG